jgi:hypothetical protein
MFGSRWMSREFKVGFSQKALIVSALGEGPSSLFIGEASEKRGGLSHRACPTSSLSSFPAY